MATRYATCPTCQTQSSISVCDNCKTDIPAGTAPTVSARVWDNNLGGFLSVDLCETCAGQDVNLVALVTPPTDQPTTGATPTP